MPDGLLMKKLVAGGWIGGPIPSSRPKRSEVEESSPFGAGRSRTIPRQARDDDVEIAGGRCPRRAVIPRHEPSAGYPQGRWGRSGEHFPHSDRSEGKWRNRRASALAAAGRSLGKLGMTTVKIAGGGSCPWFTETRYTRYFSTSRVAASTSSQPRTSTSFCSSVL